MAEFRHGLKSRGRTSGPGVAASSTSRGESPGRSFDFYRGISSLGPVEGLTKKFRVDDEIAEEALGHPRLAGRSQRQRHQCGGYRQQARRSPGTRPQMPHDIAQAEG